MRAWSNDTLDEIAEIEEIRFSDPNQARIKAIHLYEKGVREKDYLMMAMAKYYEGDVNLTLNEPKKACEALEESIRIHKEYALTGYSGKAHNILGIIFNLQGDNVLALQHYLEGLDEAKKQKDYELLTYIYNNMGGTLLSCRDYKNARAYFNKAWEVRGKCPKESLKKQLTMTRKLLNELICYTLENKLDKAKENLDRIFWNITVDELKQYCIYIWRYAAALADRLGLDIIALGYARKMMEDAKKNSNVENFSNIFECVHILEKHGKMEEAKELLRIAENQAKKSDSAINEMLVVDEWIRYSKYRKLDNPNVYYKQYYELVSKNHESNEKNQIIALENRKLMSAMKEEQKDLKVEWEKLETMSMTDALTGLLNRYGMKALVEPSLQRNQRQQVMCNLAIIDIDFFKECNDKYGHLVGDVCLQKVAEVLRRFENDHIKAIRFGGDEFFLIGEEIEQDAWEKMLEAIGEAVREVQVPIESKNGDNTCLAITVSIGAYCAIPDEQTHFHDFIHKADSALYEIKKGTRNGYMIWKE